MISAKQICLRIFIGIELALFIFYIIWGAHGVCAIITLNNQNKELEASIVRLHTEVNDLQSVIDDWQTYPFYREKYARERLQMAHKEDEIYLL